MDIGVTRLANQRLVFLDDRVDLDDLRDGRDDDDDDRARASVWASPDGAGVVVQGGF